MQVQGQVQELQEQELPQAQEQEVLQQEQAQGQELPQEIQVQQREVLLEGRLVRAQAVLALLERVQVQVQGLEALLREQVQVLAQVEAQVLDLALGVGLQQLVLEQGQVVLVQQQAQVKE